MLLLKIEKRHDKATIAEMLAIGELVKGIKEIFVFQVFVSEKKKKNNNRIKEFLGV